MYQSFAELCNYDWMYEHHVVLHQHPREIAEQVGSTIAAARVALIRHGLYQPKRRPGESRVLAHIDAERMLADAATVTSWWKLGNLYLVNRCIVQDHAIYLGIFGEVPTRFVVDPTRGHPLDWNSKLASRTWIARTWAETYNLQNVVEAAGVSMFVVRRWMKEHDMTVTELRAARDYAIVLEYMNGATLDEVSITFRLAAFRILQAGGLQDSRGQVWRQ